MFYFGVSIPVKDRVTFQQPAGMLSSVVSVSDAELVDGVGENKGCGGIFAK